MRPFLRWAGGKRWLANQNVLSIPKEARIVEPFLGGGALFFSRTWERALLADVNPFLINAYGRMKSDYIGLHEKLVEHFAAHSEEYYYKIRGRMGKVNLQDAADFIYLNRSCFNGLFRVNLAGKFNVPIGNKLFEISDITEFKNWSERLGRADIRLSDFEDIISKCGVGDFVFADPPYTVNHNSNGFIEYNEKIFSWEDQVRLHDCLILASERGAKFVLTNADHSSIRELYADCSTNSVERGSEMAGASNFRGRTTELLITPAAKN